MEHGSGAAVAPARAEPGGCGRWCKGCGAPLSRYNPDEVCRACKAAGLRLLMAAVTGQEAGICPLCGSCASGTGPVTGAAQLAAGRRLAGLRRGRGLSQRMLADAAHISVSLITKIERGFRPLTPPVAAAVCAVLDVPAAALFDDLASIAAVPGPPGRGR